MEAQARSRRRWIASLLVVVVALAGALAWWNVARTRDAQSARKGSSAISVLTARVEKRVAAG